MSQSKTSSLFLNTACRALLLSMAFLCTSTPSVLADDALLGGDMGFASSAPANSLIDNSNRTDEPVAPKLTPAQAAALVRAKVGGQVMSVNSSRSESGVIYGVKVLNDGRMRVISVDGQTGQLLNY